MADIPAAALPAATQSIHREILEQASPEWLINATPARRVQLKSAPALVSDWFQRATPAQQQTLRQAFTAGFTAQTALDKAMLGLQDIDSFAESLLVKALREQFKVQLDVHNTLLQLRKPIEVGLFGTSIGSFEVLRLPLLQAALHNFEAGESEPGAFHSSSGFIRHVAATQNVEPVDTPLTVAQFTGLCRSLDIGAQYQRYLHDYLHPAGAVTEQALRNKFIAARKADLAAAAELALLKKDIEPADYPMILSVIGGETDPWMGKKQVWFRDLCLMDKRMTGCVVFVICEKYRHTDELILYIPHDPYHPLKRFTWAQMAAMFKQRFTTRDTPDPADGSPTAYQRFFRQFVAYGDLPAYFDALTEDAPAPSFEAKLAPYAPLLNELSKGFNPFAIFTGVRELPPAPPRVKLATPEPFLNPAALSREGHGLWADNIDLWTYLYEQHRNKTLADARSHAVPTADVDARVRSEKIAKLLGIGFLVLNVVSMFVPVLGEVMMVVMAGQLLYETLEGAIEWSEGDRRAAKAHLVDLAENLALLAVMAVGGKVLSKVIAAKPEPVIEGLEPVTLDNGDKKLWRPDLTPYKTPIRLPADSRPNELGLYAHDGQTVLPLEGDTFQVRHDPLLDEYRIQHPTRPQAYAPRLEHNLEGAWKHEAESPLAWNEETLLKRLGQPVEGMSTQRVSDALEASAVEVDTLRAGFLDNNPIPLVLADTLQRFRLADEISTFVTQLKATDAGVYAKADPALQMNVLQRRGMLGDARLRVLDADGQPLWEDTAPSSERTRVVVLSEQAKQRGELLNEVLYTLQGVDPALTEFPGLPSDSLAERARVLRQELGAYAESYQGALVEECYRGQNLSNNPDVNRLLSRYPTLPRPMVEHLLRNLSEEQLQTFRSRGRLPDAVRAQAQWHTQEIRVSRAYEGLHVDALANPDSQMLALHSLETLPGWRRETRVELRQYSATGRVQDAIGPPDAAAQKHLVLREDGLFEGTPPGDLYSALWQQLSSEERKALGVSDAAQLQALIRRSPLPREPMRTVLLERPLRKPEYDPSMRLLGGAFRVRQSLASIFSTAAQRTRRLFPGFSDADITAFLAAQGDNASSELARLEKEWAKLEQDLKAWVKEQPQSTATLFDRRGGARKNYADAIVACWRRQTRELTIAPGYPINLPHLSADFSHVESLKLFNVPWTSGSQNFLSHFKQLKQLTIERASLAELPEGLDEMRSLVDLRLNGNGMHLTPTSVEQLGSLSQLEALDLSFNPLKLPPDLSRMPALEKVSLAHTQLEQWPTGLGNLLHLKEVDLSNNALREIPREHLHPEPEHFESMIRINHTLDLRKNAFETNTVLELDSYWQRVSQSHPEHMSLRNSDRFAVESREATTVQSVFPSYTLGRAREYWLSLGEGAPAELDRLQAELRRLTQQLDAWASTGGGGGRQRYIRMNEILGANLGGGDHFVAKNRLLKCWRKEAPERLASDGTPIGQELDLSNLLLQSLPALEADFSHVGSLRLSNMNMSTSPEEFLTRFRGLRWLDMSGNQLYELPPALGEMNALTRLNLNQNRIRLTADTARILSERTTLRAIMLDDNPLSVCPDFTQIRDMRSVHMSNTGIDQWPQGLGDQPLLDYVGLSDNALTTVPERIIPATDAPIEHSVPLTCRIVLSGNPLTEDTVLHILNYRARVRGAGLGSAVILTGQRMHGRMPGNRGTAGVDFTRWSQGLLAEQLETRKAQWLDVREKPGGDGFFTMLNDMQAPAQGHADLQRRVWEVIDSITEHRPESEALREKMFTWAGRGTCCDRAALSFSNVEIMTMVYRAKGRATDINQGPTLLKLARGLFRLDEVEKTALGVIEQRTAAINSDPSLSEALKRSMIAQLEEVEIRLAYRYGLKAPYKLDLPGQTDNVQFIGMGKVSAKDLQDALDRIRKLDGSPEEFKALLSRDFWKDFVVNKYRPQFEEMGEPYYEELATLTESNEAGDLSDGQLLTQSNDLKHRLASAEEALIESLSRTEWKVLDAPSKQ